MTLDVLTNTLEITRSCLKQGIGSLCPELLSCYRNYIVISILGSRTVGKVFTSTISGVMGNNFGPEVDIVKV
jgi:hypothetical protein